MDVVIAFIVGLVIGEVFGVVTIALLKENRDDEEG